MHALKENESSSRVDSDFMRNEQRENSRWIFSGDSMKCVNMMIGWWLYLVFISSSLSSS